MIHLIKKSVQFENNLCNILMLVILLIKTQNHCKNILTLSNWLTSAPALHKESTILVNPLALAHNKLVMLYCIKKKP